MPRPDPPTRDELREHLVGTRLAGRVATPRASNLGNIRLLLERHPLCTFGLPLRRDWTFDDVLALMSDRVGVHADPAYAGPDRIDPERTLDALDAMAVRLAKAAADRQRVLFATGHPTGLLALHLPLAAALAAAGCEVTTPADGATTDADGAAVRLRYLGGVAMVTNGADLQHTHSPEPMGTVLAATPQERAPDLVVADHGYAGAAAAAGLDTVGFADCNDPALFVGAADGLVSVAVPIDDNVRPAHYRAVASYLLTGLG